MTKTYSEEVSRNKEWIFGNTYVDGVGPPLPWMKLIEPLKFPLDFEAFEFDKKKLASLLSICLEDSVSFPDSFNYCWVMLRTEYADDFLNLMLNVVYPKTKTIRYFWPEKLFEFFEYAKTQKFSQQEKAHAIKRLIDGEFLHDIKFEKIDNSAMTVMIDTIITEKSIADIKEKPVMLNFYVGQVMKLAKGKANAAEVKTQIESRLI